MCDHESEIASKVKTLGSSGKHILASIRAQNRSQGLPTPKRWKWLSPFGLGEEDEVGEPPSLLPCLGDDHAVCSRQ